MQCECKCVHVVIWKSVREHMCAYVAHSAVRALCHMPWLFCNASFLHHSRQDQKEFCWFPVPASVPWGWGCDSCEVWLAFPGVKGQQRLGRGLAEVEDWCSSIVCMHRKCRCELVRTVLCRGALHVCSGVPFTPQTGLCAGQGVGPVTAVLCPGLGAR